MALKTRKTLPAGGFHFFEARTGWSPMAMMDFETTVNEIIAHRKANTRFASEWATDYESVANELEQQTCLQLQSRGMADTFCVGASFPVGPAPQPQWLGRKLKESVAAVKKYVAGAQTLIDWLGDGMDPVTDAEAERRAKICAVCPQNRPGALSDFFAQETAEVIHKQIEARNAMKLRTSVDSKLGVCGACLCPLGLKVWTPMDHILRYLKKDVVLDKGCWIK